MLPTQSAVPVDVLVMHQTSCPLTDFLRHGDSSAYKKLHSAISLTFSETLINGWIKLDKELQ